MHHRTARKEKSAFFWFIAISLQEFYVIQSNCFIYLPLFPEEGMINREITFLLKPVISSASCLSHGCTLSSVQYHRKAAKLFHLDGYMSETLNNGYLIGNNTLI